MPREDGQFGAGRSGNPSGRPKGARNYTTRAIEALLDGEAETLTRKAIELAEEGDTVVWIWLSANGGVGRADGGSGKGRWRGNECLAECAVRREALRRAAHE